MKMGFKKLAILPLLIINSFSQDLSQYQDSTLNNLVHPDGYITCRLGELGGVKKSGSGKKSMILIPGHGFGCDFYSGFISHYEKEYTIYAVTPAGFGGTKAPPMPDTSVKYSELTWTNGIVTGIIDLINKEKLDKPVIAAHFVTGTQAALNLAVNYPDKIGKVIIISGSPYRYYAGYLDGKSWDWEHEQVLTPEKRLNLAEIWWAPKWFKTVTKKTWDSFNWQPEDYCRDTISGREIFNESSSVPLQVLIRYLIEWMVYDPGEKYNQIRTPVLILIPDFSELLNPADPEDAESCKNAEAKQYLKYFFINTWQPAINSGNPLISIVTIPGTRTFMWYDNPDATYRAIDDFVENTE